MRKLPMDQESSETRGKCRQPKLSEIPERLRNFGVVAFLQLMLIESLRVINCRFVPASTRLSL